MKNSEDAWLLTPGPLSTDQRVRQAMLHDWGSWDSDFRALTLRIRQQLLVIAGDHPDYDCVPIQGSGTFAVEAMLGSLIPAANSRTLVLQNGAYGKRMARILDYLKRDYTFLDKGDFLPPRGDEVAELLAKDPQITHVVVVHCETSSGILNPLQEIATVVQQHGRKLLIDSMSAFGALPVEPSSVPFEALVSSANKCIEGVPGFGFVIAKKQALEAAAGNAHSLSLDLHDQWSYMNSSGQWRYTPPTHSLAAFAEALRLHAEEGGVAGRLARYSKNRDTLVGGMRALGLQTLLEDEWLSPIIVTFHSPTAAGYNFKDFYDQLKSRGFIIYPGKLTEVESFRIGCIGALDDKVMAGVVAAVGETLQSMGVPVASAAVV